MERDVLSLRQIMVLLVTALLAPVTDLLPTLTAQKAGGGGWLSALGALPLLLAALWTAREICRSKGICQTLGKIPGGVIHVIYLGWILLVLALSLRLSEARLANIYGEGPAFAYVAVLLAVAAWMGLGKVSAFARAGEIFYLILAVALAGVLLLAVFKVEWGNFRMSQEETAALPESCIVTAGLMLNIYPAVVLGQKVTVRARNGRRAIGWVAVFSVAIALLLGVVIGCVGPQLTTRLPAPYIIMVQGLGVKGAFQRTEALIVTLWGLSDLTLFGLLLHAWREIAGELHKGKWSRWSIVPAAAAALIGGWLYFDEAERIRIFCGRVLPTVGLLLGLAGPLMVCFLLRLRKTTK